MPSLLMMATWSYATSLLVAVDRAHDMLFFSYSRGNLLAVRAVASELRRLGYRIWLDLESLRPGERWREAIKRALDDADAMIYCVSRLSLESNWTGVELRAARDRGLLIVPLLMDDFPIEELPLALRELQLICMTDWPPSEAPSKAAAALALVLPRTTRADFSEETDANLSLHVHLALDAVGAALLGWSSPRWPSPPAPLEAAALAELSRAAEESRSATLQIENGVAPMAAALVIGALVARLGPARLRLHGEGALAALAALGSLAPTL